MEIRRPFKFAWLRGDIPYLFRNDDRSCQCPFMARSVGNAGREERTIEPLKASTGKDVAGAHGRFDPAESGSNHFEGAHRTAEVDILDRLFPVVDVLFLRAAETLFLQAINRWELFPKKGP